MTITRERVRRIVVLILWTTIVFSVVLGILLLFNERFNALTTFLATLIALSTVPPVSNLVESILEPPPISTESVRDRIAQRWVRDFLNEEQKAIRPGMPIMQFKVTCQKPDLGLNPHPDSIQDVVEALLYKIEQRYIDPGSSPDNEEAWRELIIIRGVRGGGKTTELLKIAQFFLDRESTRVPIFVNLFSWAADSRSFVRWLQEELIRQYRLPSWKAKRLIDNNDLILLLDGFGEVDPRHRRHLIDALNRFMLERMGPREDGVYPVQKGRTCDIIFICTREPYEDEIRKIEPNTPELRRRLRRTILMKEHNEEMIRTLHPALVIDLQPLKEYEYTTKPIDFIANDDAQLQIERNANKLVDCLLSTIQGSDEEGLMETLRIPYFLQAVIFTYRKGSGRELCRDFTPEEEAVFSSNEKWRKRINKDYTDAMRTRLPVTPGYFQPEPFTQDNPHKDFERILDREFILYWLSFTMKRQNQVILLRAEALFFIQDWLLYKLNERDPEDGDATYQLRREHRDQYRGMVSLITSILFLLLFLLFVLVLPKPIQFPEALIFCGVAMTIFGRLFGWHNCDAAIIDFGPNDEGQNADPQVETPLEHIRNQRPRISTFQNLRMNATSVSWHLPSGLIAGAFMGVISGLIFHDISCTIYQPRTGFCLQYESAVYAVFTFALFTLIGGMELGRRYDILTVPNVRRKYLTTVFLIAILFWVPFFVAFMIWPRTLITDADQLVSLFQESLVYSAYVGIFLGIISSLLLVHTLIRIYIMLWFLGIKISIRDRLGVFLDHFAAVNMMHKFDDEYYFRNRYIMDAFGGSEDPDSGYS